MAAPLHTVAPAALTTLEAVKEWLNQPDLDPSADSQLSSSVNAASAAASAYCQRQFYNSGTATRAFPVMCNSWEAMINLAPFDASAITGVGIVTPGGGTAVLAATEYQARPVQKPQGVYTRIAVYTLPPASQGVSASVTGTWGYAAVPLDVEEAVKMTAAKWFRRDQTAYTPEVNYPRDFPMGASDGLNLPYDARVLLSPYRRGVA